MKNFLYLIVLCLVGIAPSPGYAGNPDKTGAKPTTMVTIFGNVSTVAPEDYQRAHLTRVVFYPYDKVTLQPGPLEAVRTVIPNDDHPFKGESGDFTLTLSDEYVYKAKVASFIIESNMGYNYGEQSFRSKFYPNTLDIAEADWIDLSESPTLIWFGRLGPLSWYGHDTTTSLSGNVYDENNVPVLSHVTAYRVDTDTNGIDTLAAYTGNDTLNSNFNIPFIPQGEYILRVQPMDTLHEAGYYSEVEGTVASWLDATRIPVSQFDQIVKDIVLKPSALMASSGSSTVSGMISGRKAGTTNFAAMKGVRVYLKDESSQIKYSTYTDNNGRFAISNIAEGKYKVLADKPGYTMQAYNFTATTEGNGLLLDGIMNAGSIVSVTELPSLKLAEGEIYPNPAFTECKFQFTAQSGTAVISITNILGQDVLKIPVETIDGKNTYTVNSANFPVGIYTVSIDSNGKRIQMPMLNILR